jgi:hypothetical protein
MIIEEIRIEGPTVFQKSLLPSNKQTSIFFLFDCHDDFSEGSVESTRKGVPDETRALNDVVLRVVTNSVQVNSKTVFVPATKQFD